MVRLWATSSRLYASKVSMIETDHRLSIWLVYLTDGHNMVLWANHPCRRAGSSGEWYVVGNPSSTKIKEFVHFHKIAIPTEWHLPDDFLSQCLASSINHVWAGLSYLRSLVFVTFTTSSRSATWEASHCLFFNPPGVNNMSSSAMQLFRTGRLSMPISSCVAWAWVGRSSKPYRVCLRPLDSAWLAYCLFRTW